MPHHWLQIAQVSVLGLCGPGTNPWSAGTSLHALTECHVIEGSAISQSDESHEQGRNRSQELLLYTKQPL